MFNSKLKKGFIITLGVLICLGIGVYVFFKILLIHNINKEFELYEKYIQYYNYDDIVKINHKKAKKYISFNGIKIIDDFKDFKVLEEFSDDKTIIYGKYNDEKTLDSSFRIFKEDNIISTIKKDDTYQVKALGITHEKYVDFFEKNNISTDLDFVKYITENKNIKYNFFTPMEKLQEQYILLFTFNLSIPDAKEVTFFEGDLTGYMNKLNSSSNMYYVKVLNDDILYILTFISNDSYYNKTKVIELLSTIEFE